MESPNAAVEHEGHHQGYSREHGGEPLNLYGFTYPSHYSKLSAHTTFCVPPSTYHTLSDFIANMVDFGLFFC